MTFAITKNRFLFDDFIRIDARFEPYLDEWKVVEDYKGEKIFIPGTWNAEIFPFNYYEVIKIAGDPNFKEEENEKELSLACGWRDSTGIYDREVQINLRIEGKDVVSGSDRVRAEIIKCGGAYMKVYFNNHFITDFKDSVWWSKMDNGYQTVSDMSVYL